MDMEASEEPSPKRAYTTISTTLGDVEVWASPSTRLEDIEIWTPDGNLITLPATAASQHDASPAPSIPTELPNNITNPRSRPAVQKTDATAPPQSAPSAPARPAYRRSPSKGPRKSMDGRQFIRGTRTSVRMKPRPDASTVAAAPTAAAAAVASHRVVGSSAPSLPASTSSPRKVYTLSPRKASTPSPRKASISSPTKASGSPRASIADNSNTASGGNPTFLKAPGTLRPSYSILYRQGRRNIRGAAASLSALSSPAPSSSSPAPEAQPAAATAPYAGEEEPKRSKSVATDRIYHSDGRASAEPMAPPREKQSGTKSGTQQEGAPLPEEKVPPMDTAPLQETRSPPTPASPAHQPTASEDAETHMKEKKLLADALRELERREQLLKEREEGLKQDQQRRERQLHEREEALKQGQQRLRQDRAALEQERRQHHQEHERRRRALEEEDELQKREKARRARSRSKGRRTTRLAADDSWRRDDDRERRKKQQQQQGRQYHHEQEAHKEVHSRHTSWSSIPASSSSSSDDDDDDDAAEEPPSTTTLTNNNNTWTSNDLSASYARYTAAWAALPPHSPHVPYPSPNHTAAELHDTAHLPPGAAAGEWSADDVVKHNATRFFLAAHGVPVAAARATGGGWAQTTTTTKAALDGVGEEKREVAGRGEEELKGLVREVRKELRRWHEDGLKYRSGGGGGDQGKVNEELVRDETARAVFNAFTELRDGLLAEVRRRKEMEKVEAVVDGGGGVDWTMRSEAML